MGRKAFTELDSSRRAQVAVAWMKASAPPAYAAKVIQEQFIDPGGGGGCVRTRTKGILLTWMLPDDFAGVTKVFADGEPTALVEVVRRLRGSAALQEAWKDIQLHAQVCLRLAGAADVAVCLEVCPETWQERHELKLHIHAFPKSTSADLRLRNLAPFTFAGVQPNASLTIGGMPIQANGRASWSGFFTVASGTRSGPFSLRRPRYPSKDFWFSRIGF